MNLRVALIRGKYLNNFEGQNYIFNKNKIKLTAFSSLFPIHRKLPFPIVKFPSLADLPLGRLVKFLTNRLIGDSQILFGLEDYADKFDIFHTADSHYYYSYQLAKLRAQSKIKLLVSTSWETIPFNNEGTYAKKRIKKFTQKYVDLFICYTDRARKCLMKEGIDLKKIKVIRLGVDLNRFKPKYKKEKSPIVLFVGRQVKEKGIEDLRQLKTKNYELKILSDVPYEKLPRIYQEGDILVVPSKKTKTWEEQYGMVLIEGMASGLPIVAYDTGAIHEVLGEAGILIKPSVVQLARSIDRLIKDDNLRLKLGKIARRRAEKYFDALKTAKKIEKIYEDISGNTHKGRRES